MADAAPRMFMVEAKTLADAGQFGKAIEVLQQGLKSFPRMVSARVLLGELYWLSGDAASARPELEQVLKATPDNFSASRKLAHVCQVLGDAQAAAHACEMVLRANPKDREMRDLLETLLGEPAKMPAKAPTTTVRLSESPVAAKVSDAPAAEEPARLLKTEAEETDSETLAELYLAQGHREQGLAVYRRLVGQDPDNMALHERIVALEEMSPVELPANDPLVARKARIRRLEGWLSVIRERRRS